LRCSCYCYCCWPRDSWGLGTLADGTTSISVVSGTAGDASLRPACVTLIGGAALELGRVESGEKRLTRTESDRESQEYQVFCRRRDVIGPNTGTTPRTGSWTIPTFTVVIWKSGSCYYPRIEPALRRGRDELRRILHWNQDQPSHGRPYGKLNMALMFAISRRYDSVTC
jgi:hypothetical protein